MPFLEIIRSIFRRIVQKYQKWKKNRQKLQPVDVNQTLFKQFHQKITEFQDDYNKFIQNLPQDFSNSNIENWMGKYNTLLEDGKTLTHRWKSRRDQQWKNELTTILDDFKHNYDLLRSPKYNHAIFDHFRQQITEFQGKYVQFLRSHPLDLLQTNLDEWIANYNQFLHDGDVLRYQWDDQEVNQWREKIDHLLDEFKANYHIFHSPEYNQALFDRFQQKTENFINQFCNSLQNYQSYLPRSEIQNRIAQSNAILKDAQPLLEQWTDSWAQQWKQKLTILLENFSTHKQFLEQYGENFLTTQRDRFRRFFDGTEFHQKTPLNEDQITAILVNEQHNLVIAGPGGGKTRVLTDRVAFYSIHQGIPQDQILVLAFNNSAVAEIKQRLETIYHLSDVHIQTFHSLGFRLLRKLDPQIYHVVDDSDKLLCQIIQTQKNSDPTFQALYLAYYLNRQHDTRVIIDPEIISQRYILQENKEYEALDGRVVKSIAERDIANFFLSHQIEYQYEVLVTWCDADITQPTRTYHPDFYLPQYDIYLEHWATDEQGHVPSWFDQDSEQYRVAQQWKRSQFQKHGKILWETSYIQWRDGNLDATLKQLCARHNIPLVLLSHTQLLARYFPAKTDLLVENICQVINTAKNYNFTPDSLLDHVRSFFGKISPSSSLQIHVNEYCFFEIVVQVFRVYQQTLQHQTKIDFQDMINIAVHGLTSQPIPCDALDSYCMVLVDEFQDISYQRIRLLQEIMRHLHHATLFCVGDDWQSIYGFTGASSHFIVAFETYFSEPNRIILQYNYRNPPDIVQYSHTIIAPCVEKTTKTMIANKPPQEPSIDIEIIHPGNPSQFRDTQAQFVMTYIKNLLAQGVDPHEILVLSRFNMGYAWLQNQCIQEEKIQRQPSLDSFMKVERIKNRTSIKPGIRFCSVHKSKGLEADYVILLNFVAGPYGFPPDRDSAINLRIINEQLGAREDEERRLYFVAVTRTKKHLLIITQKDRESAFLDLSVLLAHIFDEITQSCCFQGEIVTQTEKAVFLKTHLGEIHGIELWIPKSVILSQIQISPRFVKYTCKNTWVKKKVAFLREFFHRKAFNTHPSLHFRRSNSKGQTGLPSKQNVSDSYFI